MREARGTSSVIVCECGCGELPKPGNRFINNHRARTLAALRRSVPIELRFWQKVVCDIRTGCWLWAGATIEGYGVLGAGKRTDGLILAHRLSYQIATGDVAPEGFDMCHRCDVSWPDLTYRRCVRPDHLWPGTRLENVQDMISKGRQRLGGRLPAA